MKDWKKLFSVENMNINHYIVDSNDELSGFVIDNKVRLLSDALLELCDDVTQFKNEVQQ